MAKLEWIWRSGASIPAQQVIQFSYVKDSSGERRRQARRPTLGVPDTSPTRHLNTRGEGRARNTAPSQAI